MLKTLEYLLKFDITMLINLYKNVFNVRVPKLKAEFEWKYIKCQVLA